MEGKARRGVNLQTRKAIDIPAKFDLPTSPIFTTGGEGGIRTLEAPLWALNRLAGDRFRPLSHLSILLGALGGTRTPTLRIRNPALYPIELQAQSLRKFSQLPLPDGRGLQLEAA